MLAYVQESRIRDLELAIQGNIDSIKMFQEKLAAETSEDDVYSNFFGTRALVRRGAKYYRNAIMHSEYLLDLQNQELAQLRKMSEIP